MNRTATAAVLAVALLAAAALGAGFAGAAQPGATPSAAPGSTVSVSAGATVQAAPDLAVLDLAVEATADTADAAREQVARDGEQVRTAVRDAGVPDRNVRTVSFTIHPQYETRDGERDLVGFRAAHALRVETDPGAAGAVIDAAVGSGATRVSGVQFTLTDDTRRELRGDALADAMAEARADADAVASAAGVSVTGVRSATTTESQVGPFFPAFDARESGSTVLDPGPVSVTAQVSVTYDVA